MDCIVLVGAAQPGMKHRQGLFRLEDGAYVSEDGGESWRSLNLPSEERTTWSVLARPGDPDTLYAGTTGTSIYRSTNGGARWERLRPAVPEGCGMGFPTRVIRNSGIRSMLQAATILIAIGIVAGIGPAAANGDCFDLFLAVRSHDTQCVTTTLAAGADPNQKDDSDWTPLRRAVSNGDKALETVKVLLAAGADPNLKDHRGGTPLHRAARGGDKALETAEVLLAAGADPNLKDDRGRTPLHYAVHYGDKEIEAVRVLLAAGADPNQKDDGGRTPLRHAVRDGDKAIETVKVLLAAGADPNQKDYDGKTPLHSAVRSRDRALALETVRALVAAGVDLNSGGRGNILSRAIDQRGDSARENNVRVLLAAGADPNQEARNGLTILSRAIDRHEDRALETVELLLAAGADPNLGDPVGGWAPLQYASRTGDRGIELARILLAAGADVNHRDEDNETALHIAARRGEWNEEHLRIVDLLLSAGADVRIQNKFGDTPLHVAVGNGKIETVRRLGSFAREKEKWEDYLGIVNGAGENATTLARRYAALPSRMDPLDRIPKYKKQTVECNDKEIRQFMQGRRTGEKWQVGGTEFEYVDALPSQCPKRTIYVNEWNDNIILDEASVVEDTDGVRRYFISREDRMRVEQLQKPRHWATSREIHRILHGIGGKDWTEEYLIDVNKFRDARRKEKYGLESLRISVHDQKFAFTERRRQAAVQAKLDEIKVRQKEADLKASKAKEARADEAAKQEAAASEVALKLMKVRLQQMLEQGDRDYQSYVSERAMLAARASEAQRRLREGETGDGSEAEQAATDNAAVRSRPGDHGHDDASGAKGEPASETLEPFEGPAGEGD